MKGFSLNFAFGKEGGFASRGFPRIYCRSFPNNRIAGNSRDLKDTFSSQVRIAKLLSRTRRCAPAPPLALVSDTTASNDTTGIYILWWNFERESSVAQVRRHGCAAENRRERRSQTRRAVPPIALLFREKDTLSRSLWPSHRRDCFGKRVERDHLEIILSRVLKHPHDFRYCRFERSRSGTDGPRNRACNKWNPSRPLRESHPRPKTAPLCESDPSPTRSKSSSTFFKAKPASLSQGPFHCEKPKGTFEKSTRGKRVCFSKLCWYTVRVGSSRDF